jgi:hypothetical protein
VEAAVASEASGVALTKGRKKGRKGINEGGKDISRREGKKGRNKGRRGVNEGGKNGR